MQPILLFIVLPFALGLVYRWIVLPIKLKPKNALSIRSPREPTRPESLSPEMCQFLGNGIQQFRELGFETLSNDTMANSVQNVQGVEVLMANRETEEAAVLIAIWCPHGRVHGVRPSYKLPSRCFRSKLPPVEPGAAKSPAVPSIHSKYGSIK
jgi:hypothetical protein